MSLQKIKIQSIIKAEVRFVWSCYTEPQHIVNWNFASREWCCPKAENDLTVGGKYAARMEAKDGSFGFDFEGTYVEIVLEKHLHFVMPDQRHVIIDFEAIGDNTKLSIEFDAEEMNSVELQRNGWQAILDNFKNYVEHLPEQ